LRSEISTGLRGATAAVVFASYLGLAFTDSYGTSLLFVPLFGLLFMPLAETLDRGYPLYRKITWVASVLFPFALFASYAMGGGFLDIVVYLIMFIQLYTLFHEKKERNYDHLILMSFFMLLAACVMTSTPIIAVAFLLLTLSSAWLLSTLEMYSAQQSSSPTARVEILDSQGPGDGADDRPTRFIDLRMIGGVSALTAVILFITVTFFLMTPRLEAGLLGVSDQWNSRSDLSPEIEIASGMTIHLNPTPVMRIEFPEEPNGRYSGEMYWRASSLADYTGRAWILLPIKTPFRWTSEHQIRYYPKFSNVDEFVTNETIDRSSLGSDRVVVQKIFLARTPESGLPALPIIKKARLMEGQNNNSLVWAKANDFAMTLNGPAPSGVRYLVESEIIRPTNEQLRNSSDDYLSVISTTLFRRLTKQFLLPETRSLTEEIVRDSESPFDQVTAIEQWLSSNLFTYSRIVPQLPENNPIDAFISDSRTGHCELYASALALMVRSLGIPTRLVNGYRGGTWNASDDSYTVTANMAHVWVESYFPDFGWVAFDPSPPEDEVPSSTFGDLRRRFAQMYLRGQIFWYRNVIGFQPDTSLDFLKSVALDVFSWERASNKRPEDKQTLTPPGFVIGALRALLLLPVLASIAWIALRLVRTRKPKNRKLSQDQTRATTLYTYFLEQLRKRGIDCRGKTVEELREDIAAQAWVDETTARSILSSYNAVRFGKRSLDVGLYGILKNMIRSFRKAAAR
jgi:transglutaminase-like putative cysteine protease